MAVAYFGDDGVLLTIASSDNGGPESAKSSAYVPDNTNPNEIYWDGDGVKFKTAMPLEFSRNLISGIPEGTELRVAGSPSIITDGTFAFDGEGDGIRWVRLSNPLYLDWAGNVEVGPDLVLV